MVLSLVTMESPAHMVSHLLCMAMVLVGVADIDDIYRNILLAHNIAVLRHIIVLLLCIDGENWSERRCADGV